MAKKTEVTDIAHYAGYPMCGYCYNAWDAIYGRSRSLLSPARWIDFCPVGGCDPDVWDHLDEDTGWPTGWKVGGNGMPVAYTKPGVKLVIPAYDNRVYHMRSDSDAHAPWRKTSVRLTKAAQEKSARRKGISLTEVQWDDDEPVEATVAGGVSLEDADIW